MRAARAVGVGMGVMRAGGGRVQAARGAFARTSTVARANASLEYARDGGRFERAARVGVGGEACEGKVPRGRAERSAVQRGETRARDTNPWVSRRAASAKVLGGG